MNSRNNRLSHPRILLAIALAIGSGLAGLIAAADSSVDVATIDPGFYMHHFEFDPPAATQPQKVAVGGEFNNWSETEFPLKPDGAGHFVADVKLAEARTLTAFLWTPL